jgi:hypothetical protein
MHEKEQRQQKRRGERRRRKQQRSATSDDTPLTSPRDRARQEAGAHAGFGLSFSFPPLKRRACQGPCTRTCFRSRSNQSKSFDSRFPIHPCTSPPPNPHTHRPQAGLRTTDTKPATPRVRHQGRTRPQRRDTTSSRQAKDALRQVELGVRAGAGGGRRLRVRPGLLAQEAQPPARQPDAALLSPWCVRAVVVRLQGGKGGKWWASSPTYLPTYLPTYPSTWLAGCPSPALGGGEDDR